MRATLTLDDQLAETLQALAHRSGRSFKDIVNETLRTGLTAENALPKPRRYTLEPCSMGGVWGELNFDKALALADHIEDEELVRKLQLNK